MRRAEVAEDVDAERRLSLGGNVSLSNGRASRKPDRGIKALTKQGRKYGFERRKG